MVGEHFEDNNKIECSPTPNQIAVLQNLLKNLKGIEKNLAKCSSF